MNIDYNIEIIIRDLDSLKLMEDSKKIKLGDQLRE
jgi:hypothetical protein